ncbi:hypothetical protein C7E12_20535, partial [Stenotrophomonas maltophilia]
NEPGGWARPVHRWTSIVFTLAVIANFAVRGLGPSDAGFRDPSGKWLEDDRARSEARRRQ